jgi:hypothetical protein
VQLAHRAIVLAALTLLPGPAAFGGSAAPLELERTIALRDTQGRIDHMAIDLARQRLFVAELGNGTVDVIDLQAGTVARRITGLKDPQGVGYAPQADIIAAASAADGSVRLFRGADLAPAGVVDLGDDADNIRIDPRTGNLVVGYGDGGLVLIDPAKALLLGRTPLPAHPEGFQLDPKSRRVFVNVPDAHGIAVVDLDAGREVTRWKLPELRKNFPMALAETGDAAAARIAVVFRDPPHLVILDAQSGQPTSDVATCGDADDVFLDGKRHRFYLSCGDGNVDVWQQDGGGLRHAGRIKTASGARTSLFVPELDRLYVAARAGFFGLGSDAAILVFRPVD